MLPSKYIVANSLYANNYYFDTGVYPSSNMDITALFYLSGNLNGWVFGARNTNSNTSAGQLNFFANEANTSYIGYASARLAMGSGDSFTYGRASLTKNGTTFNVLNANVFMYELNGAATTFTGTRTMYLMALNNAGTPTYGTLQTFQFLGFRISEGGVVTHEYVPVYNTDTSEFGLYDIPTDTFIQKSGTGTILTMWHLTVQSDEGGSAFVTNEVVGNVTEQYYSSGLGEKNAYLKAVARKGYTFLNWTVNDVVVSTDEETTYSLSGDTVVVAHFRKNTEKADGDHRFFALGLEYGESNGRDSDFYAMVRKMSVKVDALARTTSTIELDTVPTTFKPNMPIFVFSPKGKIVYYGTIIAVNDTTLTCREPSAILDQDFLFFPTTNIEGDDLTKQHILYGTRRIVGFLLRGRSDDGSITSLEDAALLRKTAKYGVIESDKIYYDPEKNMYLTTPLLVQKELGNLEDYVLGLFNNFGIYFKPSMRIDNDNTRRMRLTIENPKAYDELRIGDNAEAITNVSIDIEEIDTTILRILNSSGTSQVGLYGVKTDGSIAQITTASIGNDFIAKNNYKLKIVQSGDKVSTLVAENLSKAFYNHKISFDVDITSELFGFDDFQIGRRVMFYYENKVYQSQITGVDFDVAENQEQIVKLTVTLGNVRNKLTTKLNMGKVK